MRLGVCYYPEHWPQAWWAEDARQMVELGIRQVRIGEFAWSRLEPRRGAFDWAWLDQAIEVLHRAGLEVVMCTPTATPPKWLVDEDPTMLAIGQDGRARAFGSRRHYDFSSARYRLEAQRITEAVARRYGQHPAVVAWQIDNEYGCHKTVLSYSPEAVVQFRRWLHSRYGDVDRLNAAWGNVFWSQEYTAFDEIDAPVATVTEANPAHRLDYRRFASDEVVAFNRLQCYILRRCSPGRALVHNFMQLYTGFDHHAVAADLDVASWDSYPIGALEMFWFSTEQKGRWLHTGHPDFTAFHHDLYRGMSRQPFWVMEQQPGPVNWAHWNPAPALGMVRLWTWEAFAHGADVVSYFRWRQAPFAQEQMHSGLQTPDRRWDQGGVEAREVARELAWVPNEPTRPARVALVFDYVGLWLIETQPQGLDYRGLELVYEAYCSLRSLGLDVDIVPPGAPLEGYGLVVLPVAPLIDPALLGELVQTPAQLVLYPRSGSKVEAVSIPAGLPPGPLRTLIDLRIPRVESLRPGVSDAVIWGEERYSGSRWRETLEVGPDVEVLACYGDGRPAVVHQGRTHYLAGWFAPDLQARVLARAAQAAGLPTTVLPEGLRLRSRGNLQFIFNYNAHEVTWNPTNAEWLMGGPSIAAHGVAVARRGES
jgi:beta-galactosidase